MGEVRKITSEDLVEMGAYLSVLESGVVLYKSEQGNQIVTRINPSVEYTLPSDGGKASHKKAKEKEVKSLLEELEIDTEDPRAKFLCGQALFARQSGDALRSFKVLLDTFRPDQTPPVHVHRIYLSDRSYYDLVNRASDQDYAPEAWLTGPRDTIPEAQLEDLTDHELPLNSDSIIEEELKVEWKGPENEE